MGVDDQLPGSPWWQQRVKLCSVDRAQGRVTVLGISRSTQLMADKSLNRDTSQLDPATWDHRWGYRDTELVVQPDECVVMTGSRYNLCGYPMPYLIPFVRQELGFDIDFKNTRPRTPEPYVSPVNRNEGFLAALPTILRDGQFSTDDRERLIHSH